MIVDRPVAKNLRSVARMHPAFRQSGRRRFLALACGLAAAIAAVAVAASGPGPGGAAKAAAATAKARMKPPQKVNAYPLLATTSADLQVAAQQDACAFAQSQTPRGHSLLILAFRRVRKKGDEFGVGPDRPRSPFFSNEVDVRAALEAAGEGYEACRRPYRTATIAYGNTNYEMSQSGDDGEPMSTATARQAGYAQYALAAELNADPPRGVSYSAVAGDIEPGYDPYGDQQARALAAGASSQGFDYYDFGSAGHCPPIGVCQGTWSLADLAAISQANGSRSLPEIYYPGQAQQWAGVRRAWDQSPACHLKHRPRHRHNPHCYVFYGAMSEPPTCMGGHYAPWQSWSELRRANRLNIVQRHLVYFNPDCLSKTGPARTGSARQVRFPASIPDRFPETSPGRVVGDPDPLVSSSVMPRIVNGWSSESHGQITQVVAGLARKRSRARGLLVIARQRAHPYSQTLDLVAVPGSGAVKITGAPTPGKVGGRGGAQRLRFAGVRGVSGTLSLKRDTLKLRSPRQSVSPGARRATR